MALDTRKITISDLVVSQAENGYLIKQHKAGYDCSRWWVAETVEKLLEIIKARCEEEEGETE